MDADNGFIWLQLKEGEKVYLENMPYSQKYHYKPEINNRAYMKATGFVKNSTIDVILLENEQHQIIEFYPIPPLSGQLYIEKLN